MTHIEDIFTCLIHPSLIYPVEFVWLTLILGFGIMYPLLLCYQNSLFFWIMHPLLLYFQIVCFGSCIRCFCVIRIACYIYIFILLCGCMLNSLYIYSYSCLCMFIFVYSCVFFCFFCFFLFVFLLPFGRIWGTFA